MSGDTIDGRVVDERLLEFIAAARGCLYDGGVFESDERYQASVAVLQKLPGPTLLRYGCILRDRSANDRIWHQICVRFGYEFAERLIPF